MKLVFEHDWKEAFPNVHFSDMAKVYYPKRLFYKFCSVKSQDCYNTELVATLALANMREGDKIPLWANDFRGYGEVLKISPKSALLYWGGESVRMTLGETDSKFRQRLVSHLAPLVQGVYYDWDKLYDLKEMIERDEAISINPEHQVYEIENWIQFQARTVLQHFYGIKAVVAREYQPLKRMLRKPYLEV